MCQVNTEARAYSLDQCLDDVVAVGPEGVEVECDADCEAGADNCCPPAELHDASALFPCADFCEDALRANRLRNFLIINADNCVGNVLNGIKITLLQRLCKLLIEKPLQIV